LENTNCSAKHRALELKVHGQWKYSQWQFLWRRMDYEQSNKENISRTTLTRAKK